MLQKSRGIVLSMLKYNDDSFIAHVYTQTDGQQSFLVRIPKTKRASIRPSLFQPLALIDVEWRPKPGGGLSRPYSVTNACVFESLPFEPYKTAIVLFLSEFLHYSLATQSPDDTLFRFVESSIEWLDRCTSEYSNFHLVFLLRLSRFLGFYPNLENYAENCYFDMELSRFVRVPPLHSHFLQPADAALLPLLMRMRYETMYLLRLSRTDRNRLLEFINDYYKLHLPNFPELKSPDVLRDIFS